MGVGPRSPPQAESRCEHAMTELEAATDAVKEVAHELGEEVARAS